MIKIIPWNYFIAYSIPWNDKKLGHMATRVPFQSNLWKITIDLQATLLWCSCQEIYSTHKAMASSNHNTSFPPLINYSCPPQAAELSSHTITGRCCWLLCCVDLGNGYHFSQMTHSELNCAQNPYVFLLNNHSIPRNPSASPINNFDINTVMARTRHRVHSRRGGSRGGRIHPHATPRLELASPSSSPSINHSHGTFSGRHPATHSGRVHSQAHGSRRGNAATQTANLPLPPHPFQHMFQFRFHASLPQPIVIATITITFSEEINP